MQKYHWIKRQLQVDASGTIFKAMNLSEQTVAFERHLTLSEKKNLRKWGYLNYFLTIIISIETFNAILVLARIAQLVAGWHPGCEKMERE